MSSVSSKKPNPFKAGLGCLIPALISIMIYGVIVRPLVSKRTMIDELASIPAGEQKVYEVFLDHKRMVRINIEVDQGGPVSVFLIADRSVHTQFQEDHGYPGLTLTGTLRGKSNQFIMGGYYKLIVIPRDSDKETVVDIRVKKHRPRFFTDLFKPDPMTVPTATD